ncbi:MAG: hypothetical protein JNL21_20245 [Myxococcales bacterium]|nr:hypothetical protein [Myxococcales bacterium]
MKASLVTITLRREQTEGALGLARSLVSVLQKRFGERARCLQFEEWQPLAAIHRAHLDERRELNLSFRVAGELAGYLSAREGSWFRARLMLPLEGQAVAACFEELIAAAKPERAACGREVTDYASTLTFRLRRPPTPPPTGVEVASAPPGWLFACEEPALSEAIAWFTMAAAPEKPPSPAAAARNAVTDMPSYLRAPPARPAAPDETVLGTSASGPALPFQQRSPVPPPPAPAPVFDPDVTLPPVPVSNPTLPFSGRTTPERLAQIAGPPRLDPAADAGETAILPVADDVRALVMVALQDKDDLSLEEYASLRARLMSHGEDDRDVLLHFGLTKAAKEKVQQKYFERFRANPALRAQFEALLRGELRKHHRTKEEP